MLMKLYSRQARCPAGFFGRFFMARIFEKGNAALNMLMLERVAPKDGDHILEIGFGGGWCIKFMAGALTQGRVEGIDTSEAMLRAAQKRNRQDIASGKVTLVHGDFDHAEYPQGSFDTVCTANTIYFWPDQQATLNKIHSILKPGGRLLLAFVDKSKIQAMGLDMTVFTPVSLQEAREMLDGAGFSSVEHHEVPKPPGVMFCMEALK
ncbi:MAG: class I SAM-dependent methyltransferase [Desulfovibrio sp.]|nr:MAG: class I SAM-dependent methyltransferase [Desulfovibrio sp.]